MNLTSKDPFKASKEFFYQTPNKTAATSPPPRDVSSLMQQKIAFFSNTMKNFILSACKIQRLLSQKYQEDPECTFALRIFEEDKRQIERLLQKIEYVIFFFFFCLNE